MQGNRLEHTRGVQHLARAVAERTHQQRHQPIAVALNLLIILAFALAAFVPGADAFFGALRGEQMLLIWTVPMAWTLLPVAMNRRHGVFHLSFVVVFWVEMVLLWGALLLTLHHSQQPTSPIWVAVVFTSVFWATSYPNAPLQHGALIVIGLASLSFARLLDDEADEAAAMTIGMCSAVVAVFVFFAIATRRRLENEVRRDEVREELAKVALAKERAEIQEQLASDVGNTVAMVVDALREGGSSRLSELAETAQAELDALLVSPALQAPTWTAESLSSSLRAKCEALCVGVRYEQRVALQTIDIPAAAAKALLRIAQELVRNAVTHGEATHVSVIVQETSQVCLVVTNDGRRFSQSDLQQSTGGLANAKTWLEPFGGTLTVENDDSSTTTVQATMHPFEDIDASA